MNHFPGRHAATGELQRCPCDSCRAARAKRRVTDAIRAAARGLLVEPPKPRERPLRVWVRIADGYLDYVVADALLCVESAARDADMRGVRK